jgi:probable phosphoglycerate mutase
MTSILLVRHGHVAGITPERFRGRTELELTERGVSEAKLTALWIAQHRCPVALYTSPRKRCIDTGVAIAHQCKIAAHVLEELDDIDYGEWRWKSHDDVANRWPDLYRRWRTAPQLVRFPGGESLQDLGARAADALRIAIERHAGQALVLVAHDSVNRSLLLHALGLSESAYHRIEQEPCAINELSVDQDRTMVLSMNVTAHLGAQF